MNKRTVWIIAVAVVLLTLGSVAYRALFPGRFDSIRWQSADSAGDYLARREMLPDVNRLLAQHAIGNAEEAQRLLGAPERRDTQPPGSTWYYDLGGERGSTAPGPKQWLQLGFDDAGRLVAHHVRNDWSPGEPTTREARMTGPE